jgi:hypothetical protein
VQLDDPRLDKEALMRKLRQDMDTNTIKKLEKAIQHLISLMTSVPGEVRFINITTVMQ